MEAYADTIKGYEPSLEQEFADLAQSDEVEKELAELKRRKGVQTTATPETTKKDSEE